MGITETPSSLCVRYYDSDGISKREFILSKCVEKIYKPILPSNIRYVKLYIFNLNNKEIIASSDPSINLPIIPIDFIEKYCRNQEITDVLVEYTPCCIPIDFLDTTSDSAEPKFRYAHYLNITSENTIVIHVSKNTWIKDEVKVLYMDAHSTGWEDCLKGAINYLDYTSYQNKWINKNL